MISLDLWRSRIGGWRGHLKSQFLPPHCRKSNLSKFICLLCRITTCLSAITISVLLIIGGVEINPGPGSTSDEEISPMEIEDSLHDTFDFSSETLQRTPISSQVVPMTSLDLSSQCSYDVPMTPEKSLSTPKSGKRKGYQARKNRNRASMKKRRVDDEDFRKTENESRLKRFNDDYEDSDFRVKHNENQLASITKRLKDPDNRAEQNVCSLVSMTKRMEDPEKRAEQNVRNLVSMTKRMEDPEKRAEHNRYVLQKYKSGKGDFISVTIDYFFQISEGPTCVCSCCGCLHFRKSIVILTRARLDSMGDQTFIDQVCYLTL